MKQWALVVVALYVLILAMLTVPAILLAFATDMHFAEAVNAYAFWPYWLWLAVMALSQFALLTVPVRVASRRPVTQRSLWPTVLAGGLMMAGLVAGVCYSLYEFVFRDQGQGSWIAWTALALALFAWGGWALVFFRMSRGASAADVVSRQCRWLLAGSVLELLIAVPTHIVARYRDYCCAGFMTFLGLTMGASVMLFSFGPAVFFLYADRWKRLHPAWAADAASQNQPLPCNHPNKSR